MAGAHPPADPADQLRRSLVDEHRGGAGGLPRGPVPAGSRRGGALSKSIHPGRDPEHRALAQRVDLGQLRGLAPQPGLHVEDDGLRIGEPPLVVRPRRRLGLQLGHPHRQPPDLLRLLGDQRVAMVSLGAEPPGLPVVVGDHPRPGVVTSPVAHRPPGEEGAVEGRIADEAVSGEVLRPVLGWADVDVGPLAVVVRGRAEDHVVRDRADVGHCGGGILLPQVLEHLDAGHQVVPALDGVDDAADPQVGGHVGAGLGDRVARDVETPGVNSRSRSASTRNPWAHPTSRTVAGASSETILSATPAKKESQWSLRS